MVISFKIAVMGMNAGNWLLDAGADPTYPLCSGVLPIDAAVNYGHTEVVTILKESMAWRKIGGLGNDDTKKK